MPHPIIIHHDSSALKQQHGITDRPDFCSYPIRGLTWDTVQHLDYRMSLQQEEFLGNHLQLVEMEAAAETTLSFTVGFPSVFIAVMMEGFVKFYKHDELIAYAMGGVMYMAYCPRTDFLLQVNAGKHALMVVSIEKEWALEVERPFVKLDYLVRSRRNRSEKAAVLPMCRLAPSVADIWDEIRVVRSAPFIRKADLANKVVRLIDFYHEQLDIGNSIRGQLSVEIANKMYIHIQENIHLERELTLQKLAESIGVSPWKVREHARLLFGKSVHKHVRDLRMTKAARLLKETEMSILAISFKVGYSNDSHFFKVFYTYHGMSPTEYRKKHSGF